MSKEEPQVPEAPQTPGPEQGFNNERDAYIQAARWADRENHNNDVHMKRDVIPYWVDNGATKEYDTSGEYKFSQYRPQPFPVSAPVYEGRVVPMSQVPGSGTSGFQPFITPKLDAEKNQIPQFTDDQIMDLAQDYFESSRPGTTKQFTDELPSEMLEAGGINPPETPEGFGRPDPWPYEGSYSVINYQPVGTRAERDGITYEVNQRGFRQHWDPVEAE